MKKIKLTGAAFITLLAVTAFNGCRKSDKISQEELQEMQMTSEADAEADVLFNDVFDNVVGVNEDLGIGTGIGVFGRVANTNGGGYELTETNRTDSTQRCFTTSISPLLPGVFPKTVVLDFATGCLGRDGRLRKGKISTIYTGRLSVPGSKATTTFIDYYVDSVKVEGTHIVQNVSTSNNRSFSIKIENGKLLRPSGNFTAWEKDKVWIQTEGNGTPNLATDDEFSIAGTASGSIRRGANTYTWSSEILQPIIRRFTCRWALKGEKRITRNTRTGVLNFGSGNCDNQATVTVNGNTFNITLR